MPVEKITVSLPAELVSEIDRLSAAEGVSRSSLVREATAQYLWDREATHAARLHREAADGVLCLLDSLQKLDPLDKRPVLDILRESRGPLEVRDER